MTAFFISSHALHARNLPLDEIDLPDGFSIEIFAHVANARSMAYEMQTDSLIVSTRKSKVYVIPRANRNIGAARKAEALLSGMKVPNGISVHDRHLYLAEQHQISRYRLLGHHDSPLRLGSREILFEDLPDKRHHGWRYIGFGPDNKLYVTVGAACNICPLTGIEGSLIRMAASGENMEVFARGVRNSVGFDFHPKTNILHFTDNGADWMGDDLPPDELNAAVQSGQHYGFPFYGGGSARTEKTPGNRPPDDAVPPVIAFQAHSANLGILFYTGAQFPKDYHHDAFVAQHGSWNRSTPVGYRIMRIRFDDQGNAMSKEVFAKGWLLPNGKAWGRPVDFFQLNDGSLLVSDDYAGVIYRISYNSEDSRQTDKP